MSDKAAGKVSGIPWNWYARTQAQIDRGDVAGVIRAVANRLVDTARELRAGEINQLHAGNRLSKIARMLDSQARRERRHEQNDTA